MRRFASFTRLLLNSRSSCLLEGQTIQAEQIRALVFGIAGSLDHMEQYLLSEKSVLLDPEYLYVDPESLKVWLCLVPGMECDFPEDYSRFLEYLLGKVDHRDKESVALAYGLYQETRKENYGMADILRLAQQKSSVSGPNHKSGTTSQWQRSDDLQVLQSAGGNIDGEKSLEERDHVQRIRQENGWQLGARHHLQCRRHHQIIRSEPEKTGHDAAYGRLLREQDHRRGL